MVLVSIFVFIIILSALIFFHELGHFYTARKFGVKVEEFGMGLPPRLFGWRKKGKQWEFIKGGKEKADQSPSTIYSINWLPIGGFVKIKGEQGEGIGETDSFMTRSAGKRAIMLAAGVFMNVILTMVIFATTFFLFGLPTSVNQETDLSKINNLRIQIDGLLEDSPALAAGFLPNDIISDVDGNPISDIDTLTAYISANQGQELNITVDRIFDQSALKVTPQNLESLGKVAIGVSLVQIGDQQLSWYEALWWGVKGTGAITIEIFKVVGTILASLVSAEPVDQEFTGPVGIAVLTNQAVLLGLKQVLQLAALLSINLAIINILPFPALDGGRILFIVIEKIRRKPVSQKIENWAHSIGFFLLIGLIILVTYRDITRFGSGIVSALQSVF